MNDWKLFCELSLVAMVVMFVVWFAVVSAAWSRSHRSGGGGEGVGPNPTESSTTVRNPKI